MKKMNTHARGFTLIELLVVIAIIGILSSIVLASLATARSKGRAAAAKEAMVNLRSEMEVYYNGNYGTTYAGATPALSVCTAGNLGNDPSAAALVTSISSQVGGSNYICGVDAITATKWAIAATLPDGSGVYCLDNSGDVKFPAANVLGSEIVAGICQ